MPERETPSCSVLVVSCDRYRDLWPPFFALFRRYWPDCPFPVYLGSNFANFDSEQVKTLAAGADESWSKNLRFFLEQIDSSYVLLLLEDFFINRPVQTSRIFECLRALRALDGTMLRLYPHPKPNIRLKNYHATGAIPPPAAFRVSAQPALWNRTRLMALLRDGESAWEFERQATMRSHEMEDGFYGTYEPVVSYHHVIERGEWFRSAARQYAREGIGCDFTCRPIMRRSAALKKIISSWRYWILDRIQEFKLGFEWR